MATTTTETNWSSEGVDELQRRARRFRILIIGRANAGKTSILKKICGTIEDPEINVVQPTNEHGMHDIENELVFKSNPRFVFHDSRGFEAGGTDELKEVKNFITKRSRERFLEKQIHVIWYCISMEESRPITNAEIEFFSE